MRLLLLAILIVPLLASGQQQENSDMQAKLRALAWQVGPTEGKVGAKATIKVPVDYVFLDESNTRQFLQLMGNPPSDRHTMFAPGDLSWFSVFSFNPTGYVKDDEKIDPDGLLKTMKESDGPANEERKKMGLTTLTTEGWEVAPHYDTETKRLEWGTRLRAGNGAQVVNYSSRLLGRTGVMSAVLVSDPKRLQDDAASFKAAMKGYEFVRGERYAEFTQGDKIAEYGLAALILGGAAAVATKKGFWAVIGGFLAAFWKIIAGAVVAALAGMGSLFKKKSKD
jgi:uncharacterized membrane-anchored protein